MMRKFGIQCKVSVVGIDILYCWDDIVSAVGIDILCSDDIVFAVGIDNLYCWDDISILGNTYCSSTCRWSIESPLWSTSRVYIARISYAFVTPVVSICHVITMIYCPV